MTVDEALAAVMKADRDVLQAVCDLLTAVLKRPRTLDEPIQSTERVTVAWRPVTNIWQLDGDGT